MQLPRRTPPVADLVLVRYVATRRSQQGEALRRNPQFFEWSCSWGVPDFYFGNAPGVDPNPRNHAQSFVTFGRFGPFTKETEGVGFEPTVGCPTLDFESSALNRTQPPFPFCKIDILLIDSKKSAFIMRRARPFANPRRALESLRARDALD